LMDVYRSDSSIGYGIVCIPGSGWHAPFDYSAGPLKASGFARAYIPSLNAAGYTVFVINHRAAPRFQYPAAVHDAQRAVRFIRHNAARFGIRADRVGGLGGSSGGHLIHMLSVLDGKGDPEADDPADRLSAKLQAVTAVAGPVDFVKRAMSDSPGGSTGSMLGMRLHPRDAKRKGGVEYRWYRDASPITHASSDDAPTLFLHGDKDIRVPYSDSTDMAKALESKGVATRLVTIPGAGHGGFDKAKNPPDYRRETVNWFDAKLKDGSTAPKVSRPATGETPPFAKSVERNVVYGMLSGLALLMDVYHPKTPNGRGIVHLTGSGWHGMLGYDSTEQKASNQVKIFGGKLVEAGYTVFALNHRLAPTFKYPAHLEDAQRAIRFIRHNADKYGINPYRIGGVGGSSGGHMTSLIGYLGGAGDPADPDPVNRESARLQAIVPWAPPTDLPAMNETFGSPSFASFFGMRLFDRDPKTSLRYRTYSQASPIVHVTPDDPPTMMIHGDADDAVPLDQSEILLKKLKAAGVPSKLVVVPSGGHGASFPGKSSKSPDYLTATVEWFDRWLK